MLTQEIKIKTAPAPTPPAHRWIEAKSGVVNIDDPDAEPVEPGHVDVEKNQIRLQFG